MLTGPLFSVDSAWLLCSAGNDKIRSSAGIHLAVFGTCRSGIQSKGHLPFSLLSRDSISKCDQISEFSVLTARSKAFNVSVCFALSSEFPLHLSSGSFVSCLMQQAASPCSACATSENSRTDFPRDQPLHESRGGRWQLVAKVANRAGLAAKRLPGSSLRAPSPGFCRSC